MALYILEDKSLHPFLSKRTSQEISAVKSLNQRRIPTRSITDISDLSVLLSDSESIFLIPYSIGEDTLPAVEFCNLNGIPVIAMHSIPDFAPEYIYNSTGSNNWFLFSKIIPEEPKSPQTGDDFNIEIYILIILISAISLVVLLLTRKGNFNKQ